jgi:hypothetical protein
MKRKSLAALVALLAGFSLACQSVPFLAHPTPTPTVTPTPTRTPTPSKTPTPTGIPGITLPITVDGVQVKFTDVTTALKYSIGSIDYKPTSAENTFLVAKAAVLTEGVSSDSVRGWTVTLNDGTKWTIFTAQGDPHSIDSVTWVFIVKKTQTTFEIHLPGEVNIVLDSLFH